MTLLRHLERVSDVLDRAVYASTALLTAGFALLTFVSVLTRYVFDFAILSSQEVSKLFFVWACFLAATIAYKRNAHIRFEFIDGLLKPRGRALSDLLVHSLSLAFFLCLEVESVSFVRQIWETYFPLIDISQGWLYLSVTTAVTILLVHNLRFLAAGLAAVRQAFAPRAAGGRG